jgi:CIC family chloride channel protein
MALAPQRELLTMNLQQPFRPRAPSPTKIKLEIPRRLRAIVRARESSLVILAALVGACGGLVVVTMATGVNLLHTLLFGLAPGERLSDREMLDPLRALSVPLVGGLLFGLLPLTLGRRARREIDPIEANALHGGRMSLRESLLVAAQTMWSSGVGASVGLEAGYTQLTSGLASRLGQSFRLRRSDLRILVGCGSAGAIAGAFGTPFAGAFYAFELIIGTYSVTSLAPVGVAALVGYLVAKAITPTPIGLFAEGVSIVTPRDFLIAALLGLLAGAFGITLMRGIALCESVLARTKMRSAFGPALGGLIVGLLALVSPQTMSSGHGALYLASVLHRPIELLALLFALKAIASVVSIGMGFRGGMFSASLLLGALGGQLVASGLEAVWVPIVPLDLNAYATIGMAALAASVIGGPFTMVFIALETTGNVALTAAAFTAVIISAQVTREFFGYSFATWRFHLRGETIRSAADVGWMRDLTVRLMMRRGVPTASADLPIAKFCQLFPLASAKQVAAIDKDGRYVGLVIVSEAHEDEDSELPIETLLRHPNDMLLPEMNIKQAVLIFDRTEAETLVVVDSRAERHVVGWLSESFALRRYTDALELRRREVLGD